MPAPKAVTAETTGRSSISRLTFSAWRLTSAQTLSVESCTCCPASATRLLAISRIVPAILAKSARSCLISVCSSAMSAVGSSAMTAALGCCIFHRPHDVPASPTGYALCRAHDCREISIRERSNEGLPRLLLQRVLETANRVLHLAGDLVGLAVGFQLGITNDLADGLLDRAFDLLGRAGDPIVVHDNLLLTRADPINPGGGFGSLGNYPALAPGAPHA